MKYNIYHPRQSIKYRSRRQWHNKYCPRQQWNIINIALGNEWNIARQQWNIIINIATGLQLIKDNLYLNHNVIAQKIKDIALGNQWNLCHKFSGLETNICAGVCPEYITQVVATTQATPEWPEPTVGAQNKFSREYAHYKAIKQKVWLWSREIDYRRLRKIKRKK